MKKGSVRRLFGISLLLAIGIILVIYYIEHRAGYGAINMVNADIPSGFLFTEKDEIPESFRVNENYQDIRQVGDTFSDKFYCQKTQKDAEIVNYWKQTAGYGIVGGWSYRFAVVCGDDYLVVYGADHLGESIFGPFSLKDSSLSFVSFGSATMLSIGKPLEFEDGLRVTLMKINDSRCPKDVQCIWQGELSPVIELSSGTLDTSSTITLGTERTQSTIVGSYVVKLVSATETTATVVVTAIVK